MRKAGGGGAPLPYWAKSRTCLQSWACATGFLTGRVPPPEDWDHWPGSRLMCPPFTSMTATPRRPADDKVGLILGGTLDHRHRVQQRRVSGELVAQDLPDLPLGRAARAEPGLKRIATRHDRILPQPPCRRDAVPAATSGTDTRQPALTQVA